VTISLDIFKEMVLEKEKEDTVVLP